MNLARQTENNPKEGTKQIKNFEKIQDKHLAF